MSQHLAIDDDAFSVLKRNPVEGMTRTSSGGYVIVDTIERPKQVKTSLDLDKLTLNVCAYQGDGMEEADRLHAKQKQREPVMITDGLGKSWGRWVIKSVTTKYTKIVEKGIAQVLKIDISLEEFPDDESSSIA